MPFKELQSTFDSDRRLVSSLEVGEAKPHHRLNLTEHSDRDRLVEVLNEEVVVIHQVDDIEPEHLAKLSPMERLDDLERNLENIWQRAH